jgi:hypothetical protein
MFAPIALFAYRRLDHLKRTVEALSKNYHAADSDLIVFSDGPKSPASENSVSQVRHFIRSISGFRSVTIHESKKNRGLAESIINGVSLTLESYDRLIVLEDDMVTSPYFLHFMNDSLTLYEEERRVAAVCGYMPNVASQLPETFFLRGADCWGWATWGRSWRHFDPNARSLFDEIVAQKAEYSFNFDSSVDCLQMLSDSVNGRNDSWFIRWYATTFLNQQVSLFPKQSLVDNIGCDGSGTHCGIDKSRRSLVINERVNVSRIPIEEDLEARRIVADWYREQSITRSPVARLYNNAQEFLGRLLRSLRKRSNPDAEEIGRFDV